MFKLDITGIVKKYASTIIIDMKKSYEIEKIIIKWKGLNVAQTIDISTSLLDPYTIGAGAASNRVRSAKIC